MLWNLRAFGPAVAALLLAPSALAALPGYTEEFNFGLGAWAGGSTLSIQLGGVGGPADSYLRITQIPAGRMGAYNAGPELTGTLTADGVTGYRFWLSNLDDLDPLEIHVCVGLSFSNVWQYQQGFTPPDSGWAQFEVDLTDETKWVQIIGTDTFANAIASTDRLLFRHDLPPFEQRPNEVAGDFGLDRVTVLPACLGDLDGNGSVGLSDLLQVLGDFGCAGACPGDADGNGSTDLQDLLLILGSFGTVCG